MFTKKVCKTVAVLGSVVMLSSTFGANFLSLDVSATGNTYTVTNTDDSGAGSLRQAIIDANANSGLDTIDFAISGTAPFTIQPLTKLPSITDPVVVDGTSQAGYDSVNRVPAIEVDGSSLAFNNVYPYGDSDGLIVGYGGTGTVLKGLAVNSFTEHGVLFETSGNTLTNCYVGVGLDGETEKPNGLGGDGSLGGMVSFDSIALMGDYNVIGGDNVEDGNLIGAGGHSSIYTNFDHNTIKNNYIGVKKDGLSSLGEGSSLGESFVQVDGDYNIVENNLITTYIGVEGSNNEVRNNKVGVDKNGILAISLGRINLNYDSSNNIVENNIFSYTEKMMSDSGANNQMSNNTFTKGVVSMTPSGTVSIDDDQQIVVNLDILDEDGMFQGVKVVANGAIVAPSGYITEPPYTFTVGNLYDFSEPVFWTQGKKLEIMVDYGGFFDPEEITLDLNPVTPKVSITNVLDGIIYREGDNFVLEAEATDDVGVTKVEFYEGTTKIGDGANVGGDNYQVQIKNITLGAKSFTVKAYDQDGRARTSDAVNVDVVGESQGMLKVENSSYTNDNQYHVVTLFCNSQDDYLGYHSSSRSVLYLESGDVLEPNLKLATELSTGTYKYKSVVFDGYGIDPADFGSEFCSGIMPNWNEGQFSINDLQTTTLKLDGQIDMDYSSTGEYSSTYIIDQKFVSTPGSTSLKYVGKGRSYDYIAKEHYSSTYGIPRLCVDDQVVEASYYEGIPSGHSVFDLSAGSHVVKDATPVYSSGSYIYNCADNKNVMNIDINADETNELTVVDMINQGNLFIVPQDYTTITDQPVVMAKFAADTTSGEGPLTVNFTDNSLNNPTSWEWDFDNDGVVDSTEQNPSYEYTTTGDYTVKLTSSNGQEITNTEIKQDYITVSEPAPETFSVAITGVSEGQNVAEGSDVVLTANVTNPNSDTISKVEFYNGTTLLGEDTTSPYSYTISSIATDSYSVKAIAYDGGGSVLDESDVINFTASETPPSNNIYRFWSDKKQAHFYTVSEAERDMIIATWPDIWSYEGPVFHGFKTQEANTKAVHRFWSDKLQKHFYTISEGEKNMVIATWPDVWHYEGIAYYAYETQQPGSTPVYRFWSDSKQGHFYTSSSGERDMVNSKWPDVWNHYEGAVYYVPAN